MNGQPNKSGGKSLETNIQNKNSAEHTLLEAQLRECFGRVVYTHKTHEKCADLLLSRWNKIKILQIALSAITTGGFIVTILGDKNIGATVGLVISTLLFALNAYTKNYDLGELAQKHKQTANDIWLIREKYLSLITDLKIGTKNLTTLTSERDALLSQLHAAYSGAPNTTHEAYKKAQQALKQSKEMTFTDKEINDFLPAELRKKPTSTNVIDQK